MALAVSLIAFWRESSTARVDGSDTSASSALVEVRASTRAARSRGRSPGRTALSTKELPDGVVMHGKSGGGAWLVDPEGDVTSVE